MKWGGGSRRGREEEKGIRDLSPGGWRQALSHRLGRGMLAPWINRVLAQSKNQKSQQSPVHPTQCIVSSVASPRGSSPSSSCPQGWSSLFLDQTEFLTGRKTSRLAGLGSASYGVACVSFLLGPQGSATLDMQSHG